MGYKNVCINCRISLSEGTNYELFNTNKTCPTCKSKMYFVNEKLSGYDFRNPYCGHEECIYFEFPKNLQEAEVFIREIRKLK